MPKDEIPIDENTEADNYQSSGGPYLPRTKYRKDAFIETYKSLSLIIVEGLKLLALANGGGAIALLSFLGSRKDQTIPDLRWPVTMFAFGLFTAILAFGATYLAQVFIFKLINQPLEKKYEYRHVIAFVIALCFLLASASLFLFGAISAAYSLTPR